MPLKRGLRHLENEVEAVKSLVKLLVTLEFLETPPPENLYLNKHELPLRLLSKLGRFEEIDAIEAIAIHLDTPYVNLSASAIHKRCEVMSFRNAIDSHLCWEKKIVPLWREDGLVAVAMANPLDLDALQTLSFSIGAKPIQYIAEESKITRLLRESLPPSRIEFESINPEDDDDDDEIIEIIGSSHSLKENEGQVEARPIIRLCNKIIADAQQQGASDVHLEPMDGALEVRFRIDGVMHSITEVPDQLHRAVISRFKLLSGMDIADHRRPQDGRIGVRIDGSSLDIRVSCIPTSYGENLVLRLLNSDCSDLSFSALGLKAEQENQIKNILNSRGKMLLVTGPTGSGKTTTLYTCLNHLRDGTQTIETVEDPIEYRVPGVQQVQVNESADVTFASALRSLLRQDPDVIMIGEIRDEETAKIALQAAQTGHLVLSTLHTNDAPSAITRLLHLGAPSYLVASCLAGIVAQRLVRRVCESCKSLPDKEYFERYEDRIAQYQLDKTALSVGVGCEACHYTGFRGRVALYSFLEMSDELAQMAHDKASTVEILEVAKRRPGFQTLEDSAIELVQSGVTTFDDIEAYLSRETPVESMTNIAELAATTPGEEPDQLQKERVLLIEDDHDLRTVLALLLEKEMYEVIEAGDGLEGLQQVYDKRPSLVVADLMMPKMDGKEFLIKMKGNVKTKDIPVLMLTAASSDENEVELIDLGANDFIRKGSSSSVFLSRVRRAFSAL